MVQEPGECRIRLVSTFLQETRIKSFNISKKKRNWLHQEFLNLVEVRARDLL